MFSPDLDRLEASVLSRPRTTQNPAYNCFLLLLDLFLDAIRQVHKHGNLTFICHSCEKALNYGTVSALLTASKPISYTRLKQIASDVGIN
jgi:hypothetical protein